MTEFDLTRGYQFGFFLEQREGPALDAARAAEIVGAQPTGAPQLAVRLNRMSTLQQVVQGIAGNQLLQVFSFTGPPLWRADFSPIRTDVHVDALGYHETAGRRLPLDDVRRRIVPNFAALKAELGLEIARLVLVVTLKGSVPEGASLVASEFFSEAIRGEVARGQCPELTARRNRTTDWPLAGRTVSINRIEVAEAQLEYVGVTPRPVLSWQIDVNTAPLPVLRPTSEEIEAFFVQAVEWIDARVSEIESW